MIIKLIAFAAVIAMIYFIFFKKPNSINGRKRDDASGDEAIMVECKECGVFVNNKEAILKNGEFFCSKECAGVR
jgi:uncharacterized protein